MLKCLKNLRFIYIRTYAFDEKLIMIVLFKRFNLN